MTFHIEGLLFLIYFFVPKFPRILILKFTDVLQINQLEELMVMSVTNSDYFQTK